MKSIQVKNMMIAMNMIAKLGTEAIEEFEADMYNDQNLIRCVDAVHIDCDAQDRKEYTWYISTDGYTGPSIAPGDTLVVEQTVGIGLAFVEVRTIYWKTKARHADDIHPYCKVLHNLGVILNRQSAY